MLLKIMQKCDQRQLLGLKVWEFSFRSLVRRYGWYFIFHFVLPAPVRFFQRLQEFRRSGRLSDADRQNERPMLLAAGYCLKPLPMEHGGCPVGRFNHECALLNANRLDQAGQDGWPVACRNCKIAELARLVGPGVDFYLMTSALDIARDLLRPQFRRAVWRRGIFILCPYATDAFALALASVAFQGEFIQFCRGDCRDYPTFIRADVGIKSERTELADSDWQHLHRLLPPGAQLRPGELGFKRLGNLYRRERSSLPGRKSKQLVMEN